MTLHCPGCWASGWYGTRVDAGWLGCLTLSSIILPSYVSKKKSRNSILPVCCHDTYILGLLLWLGGPSQPFWGSPNLWPDAKSIECQASNRKFIHLFQTVLSWVHLTPLHICWKKHIRNCALCCETSPLPICCTQTYETTYVRIKFREHLF